MKRIVKRLIEAVVVSVGIVAAAAGTSYG